MRSKMSTSVKRSLLLKFILCALLCTPLFSEKIVQCVTNFPIDVEFYTRALQERGYEGRVVVTQLEDYGPALLKKRGWFDWRINLSTEVDKIVFFNLASPLSKRYDLSRLPKEKMVLFLWEPQTVLRKMYTPKIHALFSKIYTWDDTLVDQKQYFKFNYPAFKPMLAEPVPFTQRKLCTLIASDRKSGKEHELYSQRKEAIAYFERVKETGFEFYGRSWDPTLYSSYRGSVADKQEVMKNYKFCICYENTEGVQGYITEKIFDCFAAGVVPIYWGASNIEAYIPKGCWIDRREFSSLEELHQRMLAMSAEEHQGYLERIRQFLQSPAAQEFTEKQLAERFYEAVFSHG